MWRQTCAMRDRRIPGRAGRWIPGVLALLAWLAVPGAPGASAQQTGTVTGRVTNALTGAPVATAQVFVVGAEIGGLSRSDGRFLFTGVPAGTHQVRVQSIGYATATREVTLEPDETTVVNFQLREEAIGLDEIVVTGLPGAARRREVGTVLTQLNFADLEQKPLANVEGVLRNAASGVQSLSVSGQVGGGGTLQLRGVTSVSQGNEPLVYVDGVRLSTRRVPPANLEDGRGPRISGMPLNEINPADIERIEIIKGAAATTLYGTEASGGVVQIFTKRGATGSPQWSVSSAQGVNFWPRMNDVIRSHDTQLDLEPAMRSGWIQRYDASVRGGTDNIRYFFSASRGDEDGIVDTQWSKNWSTTANLSVDLFENVRVQWNNSYSNRQTRYVPDSNNRHGYLLNVIRMDKGYKPGVRDASWILETELLGNTDNFISGLKVEHLFPFGVRNSLQLGLNHIEAENSGLLPFGYFLYEPGSIGVTRWRNRTLTLEYTGTWERRLSDAFRSTFAWGGQMYDETNINVQAGGLDFAGPGRHTVSSAARTFSSEDRIRQVNAGFFFQETVGWRDRLFLIGGLRVDGSSTFGEDYGLQTYPKLSASYVISESDFWNFDWWSTLRLRAAVGEAGRAPGAFDSQRTWTSIAGLKAQPGVTPSNLGEPNLGPERTREIELGFDSDMLGGRFNVELTYYSTRTMDALFPVLPPPSEGFTSSQLRNIGEITSDGIELSTNVIVVQSEPVSWRVGMDLTTTNTDVKDMGGAAPSSLGYQQWIREGYPAPSFFGRRLTNPDEIAEPIFEADQFLGESFPTKKVNFRSDVTLAGALTVSGLAEWSIGGHVLNNTGHLNTVREIWPSCDHVFALTPAERQQVLPARDRARCLTPHRGEDLWIEPGDFFKIRDVTAALRIPETWLPRTVASGTLAVTATNLLTRTDFTGMDPEVIDGGSSGTQNFRRVDYYNFPPRRSVTMKLGFTF